MTYPCPAMLLKLIVISQWPPWRSSSLLCCPFAALALQKQHWRSFCSKIEPYPSLPIAIRALKSGLSSLLALVPTCIQSIVVYPLPHHNYSHARKSFLKLFCRLCAFCLSSCFRDRLAQLICFARDDSGHFVAPIIRGAGRCLDSAGESLSLQPPESILR